MIGIYRILNTANSRAYIGSSQDISGRWKTHRRDLRANRHANRHLQNAWNKYGEQVFCFEVVHVFDTTENLIKAEDGEISDAKESGICVYNTRLSAANNRGLKLGPRSASTKAKISKSRAGIVPCNIGIKWNEDRRNALTQDGRHRLGAPRRSVTHCPHGHHYSPENTYHAKNSQRQCRECNRIRMLQKRTLDRMKRGVEGTNNQ